MGVSTRRDTSTSVAGQPDLSAARQTRQHKKSSKGGVEFQSQSLTDNSVARRRLATSDRKLRNRSSGACFGTSLDVLEQQGDSPEERCEGDSPEQTIRQRLKMFENKPVMGSVCMCACMHVYTVLTCTCVYIYYVYTYVRTCTYVCVRICTHVYVRICICT